MSSIEKLFTPRELADLARFNVATVYRAVERGELRALRLSGGRLRFRPADIRAWLAVAETAPEPEPRPRPRRRKPVIER